MVLQVPSQKLGFAENFMLSGSAAIISKTCAAPLERMKLLIQNQAERVKVPIGPGVHISLKYFLQKLTFLPTIN